MCDCKIEGDIGYSFKTTYTPFHSSSSTVVIFLRKKGRACEQNLLTPLRISHPLPENWQEIKLAPSIHHLLPREMTEEHPLSLYHLLQEVPGEIILILHYLRATKRACFFTSSHHVLFYCQESFHFPPPPTVRVSVRVSCWQEGLLYPFGIFESP